MSPEPSGRERRDARLRQLGLASRPERPEHWLVKRLGGERCIGLILPLVLAAGLVTFTVYRNMDYWKLDTLGKTTQATILDKIAKHSSSDNSLAIHYTMRISFKPGETMWHGTVPVTSDYFDRHEEGERVPVTYLPSDPRIGDIDPEYRGETMYYAVLIALFLCAIGAYNFFTLKPVRREPAGKDGTANPKGNRQ